MITHVSVVLHHFIFIILLFLILDYVELIIFSEIVLLLFNLTEVGVELSTMLIALSGVKTRFIDHLSSIKAFSAWLHLLGVCYLLSIVQNFLDYLI
jgi:hypothetical protein